ncbi:MAG: DUF3194 domain-containing protein [Nitrososphaerota archaeon]
MQRSRVASLSQDDLETLAEIAEEAARKHITTKVSSRGISDMTIMVNLDGARELKVEVDVELTLSPALKDTDARKLADDAVKEAFKAVEKYLERL